MRVWGPRPVFITLKPGVSGTDERGTPENVLFLTRAAKVETGGVQEYLAHEKQPPHHRALGIVLL